MAHCSTPTGAVRAACFIDGQNLFYSARQAFGYREVNYDPKRLSEHICAQNGWALEQVRFYSGIPAEARNAHLYRFWRAKGAKMSHSGVHVYFRPLVYRDRLVERPDGTSEVVVSAQEKGIDVRLALEVVRAANERSCEIFVLFSRDNDLSEVADEVHSICRRQGRVVQVCSAYPFSDAVEHYRGITNTAWKPIDRLTFDACLDGRNLANGGVVSGQSSLVGLGSREDAAAVPA